MTKQVKAFCKKCGHEEEVELRVDRYNVAREYCNKCGHKLRVVGNYANIDIDMF